MEFFYITLICFEVLVIFIYSILIIDGTMSKKIILSLLILTIIIINGCVLPKILDRDKTTPSEIVKLEDIRDCLVKQEETYKPGWEGAPTRVINNCEILAGTTNNLTAINILVETEDFPTLASLSNNPNAPLEILSKIYYKKNISENWQDAIKSGLSNNINTASDILAELGQFDEKDHYQDLIILMGIAKNPNTPIATLKALSLHKNSHVLIKLARNSKTPKDVLIYLSQDLRDVSFPYQGEEDINIELARNPNTPKDILIKFLKEKGNTSVILNFEDNIVRIENEILELEDYYMVHFPVQVGDSPSWNGNYHALLQQLVTNPATSENILNIIIRKNYNDKTLSQRAEDNLNNRK